MENPMEFPMNSLWNQRGIPTRPVDEARIGAHPYAVPWLPWSRSDRDPKLRMARGKIIDVLNGDFMGFYSDLMGFYSDLMGIYSDLMGIYSDFMGFYSDLMGIYSDLMGFYSDLLGFYSDSMAI